VYVSSSEKIKINCKVHGLFIQRADDHLAGSGCPKCSYEHYMSKGEIEFMDKLGIPLAHRQFPIDSLRYIVDGFDVSTNTVYEFLGDYWHGNPKKFKSSHIITHTGKTCGQAYKYTFKRFYDIKKLGYDIKYIWESDWNKWKENPDDLLRIEEYKG
jgi:hypothetical protein